MNLLIHGNCIEAIQWPVGKGTASVSQTKKGGSDEYRSFVWRTSTVHLEEPIPLHWCCLALQRDRITSLESLSGCKMTPSSFHSRSASLYLCSARRGSKHRAE